MGGFVRSSWDEVNEIIAAANVYTIKKYGPDRVIGFSPIPAMSMVSYAAGSRYLSLIGGVCMSFYDWYCDLPPSSPQIWGEQTDVPESADWYNSTFIIAWGSNVPQTRTPDAHFFTEVRYKGAKTVAVTPDYSEVAKLADIWLHPKQGTDAALAMAMGHVILKEFYSSTTARSQRVLRRLRAPLHRHADAGDAEGAHAAGRRDVMVPDRYVRASDFDGKLGQANNPEWKTVAFDESGKVVLPNGAIGFRWGPEGRADQGQWNLEAKEARHGHEVKLRLSLLEGESPSSETQGRVSVLRRHRQRAFPNSGTRAPTSWSATCRCSARARRAGEALVATVFDLMCANYGVDRGLRGELAAKASTTTCPTRRPGSRGSPACRAAGDHDRAPVRGQRRQDARQVDGDHRRRDEPLVPLRHELPRHHQHADHVRLRRQSGGGWAHYVGQEKLRPQTGWTALLKEQMPTRPTAATATMNVSPPSFMAST